MVLRQTLLAASGSDRLRTLVAGTRLTRGVVDRFVAGERAEDAVRAAGELAEYDLLSSIDHLGEDADHPARTQDAVKGYVRLLRLLDDTGLTSWAEVSVKPTAVGLGLGPEGEALAVDNLSRICDTAAEVGTTVTVDMEAARHVPATLRVVARLRARHPWVGCVLQSYLRRTEGDTAAMAAEPGARVRLCKGAYAPERGSAYTGRREVDAAFVRSLRRLMTGSAYPMVATHDSRLIDIATTLARRYGRTYDDFEYQMLYGARPTEQRRLASLGARVRVYVPYGTDWYGYLVRRVAERPANAAFAARQVLTRY
ncbi:proline dehydrogenase family protein [Streptomonospora nanhaiensis]|uniref:proline dehydrogenase family protein n=1 Tax=Streptomonospora nanhaiensis TaxID=1323731 RepID=UPI001C997173|nr:proline dehydrogenase family protein [Streptomonospora nanhaiensis]MBX9388011.1 proline dehydrogenase family protein [Streptomonospora nanhaiensis]